MDQSRIDEPTPRSAATPSTPRRRRPPLLRRPPLTGAALLGALVVAAGLVWALAADTAPVEAPFRLPLWVFVVLYALAQRCIVSVQLWREAHSYSVCDLVLVLGLFFAAPGDLVLAAVAGSAFGMIGTRAAPHKAVFNLAVAALETGLTILAFTALASLAPGTMWSWAAAVPATALVVPVSASLVFVAISLAERGLPLRDLASIVGLTLVGTVTNTLIGLTAARLLWHEPQDAWLVLAPSGLLVVAYRAYVRQRRRREGLELLFESARLLHTSPNVESALGSVLALLQRTVHAGHAEALLLPPGDDDVALRTLVGPDGTATPLEPVTDDDAVAVVQRLASGERPRVVAADAHIDPALTAWLAERGLTSAVVVPLVVDARNLGILLLGDRTQSGLDDEDASLLEMLAGHTAAVLTNGHLQASIARLAEREEELRRRALHDPLTGLANRALFAERVENALAGATEGELVSVLFVDLDGFKSVNDTLGHDAGDQLLRAVAERLRRCLRRDDLAARLGGDEFAIVLEKALVIDDEIVARRIVDAISAPFGIAGHTIVIGASVGVATAPAVGATVDGLVRDADAAMYRAKRAGKGRIATAPASGAGQAGPASGAGQAGPASGAGQAAPQGA